MHPPQILSDPVAAAADAIRRLAPDVRPELAIVSGSGLGVLATLGETVGALDYVEIPGFGAAGVAGHANRWLLLRAGGQACYCLLGRRHLYEGIQPEVAGLTMRVLARLGVRHVVLTNAAGGLGSALRTGDLMLIRDHLNLMFRDPERRSDCDNQIEKPSASAGAANPEDSLGVRQPEGTLNFARLLADVKAEQSDTHLYNSQSAIRNPHADSSIPHSAFRIPHCYDPELSAWLLADALAEGIPLREGVYAGVSGPCYETRAEVAMLRLMGGDAVGMSTVPEALVAARAGLRVAAVSLVTNSHWHRGGPASHDEVLAAAAASGERLQRLLRRFLARFANY